MRCWKFTCKLVKAGFLISNYKFTYLDISRKINIFVEFMSKEITYEWTVKLIFTGKNRL